jgi:hypothetical protein
VRGSVYLLRAEVTSIIVKKSVVRPDAQKDVDAVRAIEGFVRGFYKPPSTRRYSLILIEPLVPGSSG